MAITTPDAVPGEVIEAAWGDAVRADLTNLDSGKVGTTGTWVMTGDLTANVVYGSAAQLAHGAALTRKDYVDTKLNAAGGTMSGSLSVGATPTASTQGSLVRTDGLIQSTVTTGAAPNSLPNLVLTRTTSPAQDAGGLYARFDRTSAGTAIGSIAVAAGGAAVVYNTTSDYRLKDVLGAVADPLGRLNALIPRHLRWKDTAAEFDGFLAHEVQDIVPHAVTGAKDAVVADDDEWNPGAIAPQQLDAGQLIPLLVAACQALAAKVAALEAAT